MAFTQGSMDISQKIKPQMNHLLAALPPEAHDRLFPHLELVRMPLRQVLYETGAPMSHVYFPADAIISMQHLMEDGVSAATSVVGNED